MQTENGVSLLARRHTGRRLWTSPTPFCHKQNEENWQKVDITISSLEGNCPSHLEKPAFAPTEKAGWVCSGGCTTSTSAVTFLEISPFLFFFFFFFCIQNETGLSLVCTNQRCRYSCDETVGTLCQNVCNGVLISWHLSGMFVLICGVRAEDSSGTSSYSSENDIFKKKATQKKNPWNWEAPLRVWFKWAIFQVQVNNWLWLSLVPWLRRFAREIFLVILCHFYESRRFLLI